MKVISIGTDRKVFEEESQVFGRNVEYASKMDELHIVVFTLKREGLTAKKIGNLYLYPTNSFSEWLYVWDALRLSKNLISQRGLLKNTVISTQDPFQCGFVGVKLAKRFHLPLQVQVHTDFLSPYFSKSFFNKVRKIIASYVIPRASSLRVVGDMIKNSIEKKFSNLKIPINVLPIFFNVEKMAHLSTSQVDKSLNFPQLKFTVLMASRLSKEKRIDVALCAFKKVLESFPYAGLVIAGSGPEENNLKNLTKELGLTSAVVFLGWRDDLLSLYKSANVFLLTSEYEGYGMVLVEAALSSCPIITTNVGIAQSGIFVNGVNSFVCPVGDVDAIARAILELITDNAKRELFKWKMQDSIKEKMISKEEYMASYIALLQNLLR